MGDRLGIPRALSILLAFFKFDEKFDQSENAGFKNHDILSQSYG
jgi:hypothetical protein